MFPKIEIKPIQQDTMFRFNSGKMRLSLVPPSLSYYAAATLTYGAVKYEANNWRKAGSWSSVMDSFERHYAAFKTGEDDDPESGLPHLAHMAANIAFLIEFFDKGLGTDDRFRYAGNLQGRVLEFRQPPRRQQDASGGGAAPAAA